MAVDLPAHIDSDSHTSPTPLPSSCPNEPHVPRITDEQNDKKTEQKTDKAMDTITDMRMDKAIDLPGPDLRLQSGLHTMGIVHNTIICNATT